jgi:hypothetical protein
LRCALLHYARSVIRLKGRGGDHNSSWKRFPVSRDSNVERLATTTKKEKQLSFFLFSKNIVVLVLFSSGETTSFDCGCCCFGGFNVCPWVCVCAFNVWFVSNRYYLRTFPRHVFPVVLY